MTEIFNYNNYREYLRDFFEEKKSQKSQFSHRVFAKKAGLASAAHLGLVIKNQRNLTLETIEKFSKGLGLKGREKEYFRQLVLFNQTQSPEEKMKHLDRLKRIRFSTQTKLLDFDEQTSLYEKWYYPFLYELTLLKEFRLAPDWIRSKSSIPLKDKEIIDAYARMLKSNLLIQNENKTIQQGKVTVKSSDEVNDALIRSFHLNNLKFCEEQLSKPISDREFGALTIAIPRDKFAELKTKIKDLVQDWNTEYSSSATDKDQVVQLNFQLVKLTK